MRVHRADRSHAWMLFLLCYDSYIIILNNILAARSNSWTLHVYGHISSTVTQGKQTTQLFNMAKGIRSLAGAPARES